MIVFCWFADFDTVAPCNNTCLKDYLFRVECFPFWDFCTLLNAAWPDHFEDCSSAGVTRGSKGVGNLRLLIMAPITTAHPACSVKLCKEHNFIVMVHLILFNCSAIGGLCDFCLDHMNIICVRPLFTHI